MRTLAATAVALLLAPASAGAAGRPPIVVQASRSAIRQGETVRLGVRIPVAVVSVSVAFAGRSWAVYRAGPLAWRTILGTDPITASGRHTVIVEAVTRDGVRLSARREVTVAQVAYPKRRVTFDPDRAALLTAEAAERERRRVQEALRVLHETQLWEDPLLLPADGPVSSPYGVLSIYQGVVRGFHGGADIAAPEGTPVRSAGEGIVRLAELLPLSGNAVMIDHGLGVVSSYHHMSEITVRVGQRVAKGDVIGRVGSTGLATGPHLHWGLRVNGVRVDPMPWTAAQKP